MKIKVTEKSWKEVEALPRAAHKDPIPQGAFFRWLLKTVSAKECRDVHLTCEKRGLEALEGKEPCLYLMNHSSFTDLQIASVLLADRPFQIICTNDGFVGKEMLMRRIGCIPARKFITDPMMVKDMKYAVEKLRNSILMFPEASYSFDGTETPLPKGLGRCLKFLGVPVVMIRTRGAFLRDPLYNNLQKRQADVQVEMSLLCTAEDVREKSQEELSEILAEAFHYDHFREQKERGVKITEAFRADGLHRALYKCPHCLTEGQMTGKGELLTCAHCGKVYRLNEDGTLQAQDGETAFAYVSDWYAWERECVRKELEDGSYRMENEVDILVFNDYSSMYRVGSGTLVHDNNGFVLTGCDGLLNYRQSPAACYSLYADYFWYEIGDMISIGDSRRQYYCFPKDQENAIVAKARLAAEELFKLQPAQKKGR